MIDFSIIFAGFGGQGILSAGKMAAEAALYEGKEVSWFPSYGPEMRGGIDRMLVLSSGKTLSVDEKVRERDWPDVLLEYWSDTGARTPGWVAKDLACDLIAYAFVPSQTCLLLPFQQLRRAWQTHRKEWVSEFPTIRADNGRYITTSVAVPRDELMKRIGEAMFVSWAPEDDAA